MASFCGNCGFPMNASAAFCANCGARQPGAGGPAPSIQQPGPVPAPQAAAATSGSGLKIVLIIAGVLVFGGIAVIGGLIYVGHRVKTAVVEKAKEYGVDVPSSHEPRPVNVAKNTCDYLSKAEVSGLIGEPIERAEAKELSCEYYGPAGLSTKLANEQASGTMKTVTSEHATDSDRLAALREIANTVGAGEQISSGAEMPLLILAVNPNGRSVMLAMNITKGLFSGIGKNSGAPSNLPGLGSDVPGIGDQAVRLPKEGLNVLKGEVLVRVIAGPIPDSETKTIEVARAVLKKL